MNVAGSGTGAWVTTIDPRDTEAARDCGMLLSSYKVRLEIPKSLSPILGPLNVREARMKDSGWELKSNRKESSDRVSPEE